MATVSFGGGVSEIRGSVNGNTFSRNANGAIMRNRTTPINGRTARQVAVRGSLASIASGWRGLTEVQRQSWIDGAPNYPYTNRLGQPSVYTGQQLYMKLNQSLGQIGEAPITTCPLPVGLENSNLVSVVFDDSPDFTFTWAGTLGADNKLQVFCSGPVSTGVMRINSTSLKLVGTYEADGSDAGVNIEPEYEALFGEPVAGTKVFVRIEIVSKLTGQREVRVSDSYVCVEG